MTEGIEKITEKATMKMKLKAKPKCKFCGKPLAFVYDDASGHINEKCRRCGNSFTIDLTTLEVTPYVSD
jgi:phage FluMu protein Com